MAKRKRLTPAEITALKPGNTVAAEVKTALPLGVQAITTRRPPIAQVAGDAAVQAALEEVTDELQAARNGGRMVLELPLSAVDETYLVRDRMMADEDELSVLMESLRARGQQTPIEVTDLGQGRYGLISGWRRLTALRRLGGAGKVNALLRSPDTASDAYLAMVEENEIRVGLSYYERARIVARAAEQGAYHNQQLALSGLFASVSRPKRSKIGSFVRLYTALDDRLQFPAAISERLGLALVRALDDNPDLATKLRERLRKAGVGDAAAELAVLERASQKKSTKKQTLIGKIESHKDANRPVTEVLAINLKKTRGRVVLSGAGVTDYFATELQDWLATRKLR